MKSLSGTNILLAGLLLILSCRKPPYKVDTMFIDGYVIGKETCHTDPEQDYWLIDCTKYPEFTPRVGDTIVVDNETYTNVIKVKGLAADLQQLGESVYIEYKKISTSRIVTTGCEVASPITYTLREIFIIHQGRSR